MWSAEVRARIRRRRVRDVKTGLSGFRAVRVSAWRREWDSSAFALRATARSHPGAEPSRHSSRAIKRERRRTAGCLGRFSELDHPFGLSAHRASQYPDMPRNAVATGAVDLVLPAAEIGARLATLLHNPYLTSPTDERVPASADSGDHVPRVLAALQKTSGVDFSQYRDTTITR